MSQHVTLFEMGPSQLRKQIVIILVGPKPNDKCPCGDEADRQTQEGVGKAETEADAVTVFRDEGVGRSIPDSFQSKTP